MTTLTAFADLHLGASWAPGAEWALEELAGRDTDVVVFAGDLIDRRNGREDVIQSGVDLLRTITQDLQLPVVLIWGNHDAAIDVPARFPHIDGVYAPEGSDHVQALRVPNIPLTFHAIHVATKRDKRDVVSQFPTATEPGHIGVFHSSVEGQWSKNACLPARLDDLVAKNYQAWILGHVHEPLWLADAPPVFYPGPGQMVDLTV